MPGTVGYRSGKIKGRNRGNRRQRLGNAVLESMDLIINNLNNGKMNATINGTNYHSDLKFNQEKGEITIEVIQCRKVICQKITKMDLSLSQLEQNINRM